MGLPAAIARVGNRRWQQMSPRVGRVTKIHRSASLGRRLALSWRGVGRGRRAKHRFPYVAEAAVSFFISTIWPDGGMIKDIVGIAA